WKYDMFFFFSSRRRHTRSKRDWSSDVCSSDLQAHALDELQNTFTDGPCMRAIRENAVIRAGDLRTDNRWPDYQAAAVRQGVRAVLGLPFDLDEDAQAGLNVYSAEVNDFCPETIRAIELERSEEHTSELQSRFDLVCRLLLEK